MSRYSRRAKRRRTRRRNREDEYEAIGKREEIHRKADRYREHDHPNALEIAALYEKHSLQNVEIGLENRQNIRNESLQPGFLKRLGQQIYKLFGFA